MEKKELEALMKELKTLRKLLTAGLYIQGVSSEDLNKLTGMGAAHIRGLVSKRGIKGEKNA